ncbi:MAG: hypothetical protein ACOYME_10710 [Prochlorotrichaceae cyanobacterium]|jgi:hypothetical protein
MKRFLQETWELFYWALWCPSPYPLLEDWLEDALPALGRRRLLLTWMSLKS